MRRFCVFPPFFFFDTRMSHDVSYFNLLVVEQRALLSCLVRRIGLQARSFVLFVCVLL